MQTFYATLAPEFRNRVTIMTMSEFGRTPASNSSVGTDHGTAAPHVRDRSATCSGGLYGAAPSLTALDKNKRLDRERRLPRGVRHRARRLAGRRWQHDRQRHVREPRPVQRRARRRAADPGGTDRRHADGRRAAAAAGFVPMSPLRVFDTRDGTGGRIGALRPGRDVDVRVRRPVRHPRRNASPSPST